MRSLDIEFEIVNITSFIYDTVKSAGYERVILGLSGGLDSAVVAGLCTLALSKVNVIAVMMPYKNSHPDSLAHAKLLVDFLGIESFIVPVTEMVDTYFDWFESEADMLRRGNRIARERMCILYDLSSKYKALVVGTSNKSEIYSGYCTQFGDSASAFEPIAHLYKTEVYEIASTIKIPEVIIDKKPTADLWEGQTDENELGITYNELDKILYLLLDEEKDVVDISDGRRGVGSLRPAPNSVVDISDGQKEYILSQGISEFSYDLVIKKINNSSFKRRMPLTLKGCFA